MVNRFYSNIHRVVARHCSKGGVDGKFRKVVGGYNPDTRNNLNRLLNIHSGLLSLITNGTTQANHLFLVPLSRADKQYLIDPVTVKDVNGNVAWPDILPEER